jgi:hypothetical protein
VEGPGSKTHGAAAVLLVECNELRIANRFWKNPQASEEAAPAVTGETDGNVDCGRRQRCLFFVQLGAAATMLVTVDDNSG